MVQTNKLATQSIGKLLFSLSVPAIAAQIINVLYSMVDRIYIGHIKDVGADALTGVGVTFPVIMIISAFAMLIGMGGAPRAAIMMGENNNEKAEQVLGNCICTLFCISLVLTFIFFTFSEPLLRLFGASDKTIYYANSYLRIYSLGTLFVQFSLGLNAFITSQGFANTAMKTVLLGAVTNIILDPIFIFVFNMGVRGAALATIISQGLSALWVMRFLLSKKTILKVKKENLRIEKKVIFPVLALGVSPFIMSSTESLLNICFNTSLLKYGSDIAVGAMTILSSVMQFAMMPLQGLSQGAQPIVSYNFGAKNSQRVRSAFKLLLITSVGYSTIMWLFVMVFPQFFASLFTSDINLINITKNALRVYMACMCIFGAQIACQQTFIALGNAKCSLFLAILRKIILLIPLIYILPFFFEDKVFAVFLAEPVADFLAVSVTVSLFVYVFKKTMKKLEV